MKKLIFSALLMILATAGFSQYNDTLYYKSGGVKAVTVREHDDLFLTYEYRGKRGKLVDNRISISTLKSFVIYNEYGEVTYDSRTAQPKKEGE